MDARGCEMKLWIIGSGGLLGQTLLSYCRQEGIDAIGTTHFEADICNFNQLKDKASKIHPAHIVNCAAYTNVDGAEGDQERAFAVNCEGAGNVALVARELSCPLVHISTDYVFDGNSQQPYREEDLCAPINIYGKSKWAGEKKVLELLPSSCILRTSWLFAPQGKSFISSLLQWFQQKEELQVVCDQEGKPTYCPDLAEAIIALLDTQGIVHFASQGGASRFRIALDLLEAVRDKGIPMKCKRIIPVRSSQFPTPASRPAYSVLDTSKYAALTSKQPRPWRKTINEFLDATLKI